MTETISLNLIRTDGGTQSRIALTDHVIGEYEDAMRGGAKFPPLTVFYDGSSHWLADGYHRYHAYVRVGETEASAYVHQGTRRDAILYSVGANASHGLRRSNADKRRAATTLLSDPEWSSWSDSEIARRVGVSHTFVGGVRGSLETVASEVRSYTTKHGTPATMDTAKIGGASPSDGVPKSGQTPPHNVQNSPEPQFDPLAVRAFVAPKPDYNGLTPDLRIIELMDHVAALEGDIRGYVAELKTYREMKVLFEKGGFDAVVAAKDELIRGMDTRNYSESEEKARWMRRANFWEKEAKRLGWKDTRSDHAPADAPTEYDDTFYAATQAEG